MVGLLLRFRDLKDRRIVSNHVTLGRWIAKEGFPPGFMLGPNTWVWREDDIDAWIARPRGVRRVDVFVGLAREKEVPFMRAHFTLSGSGKRQKYCSNCSKRGIGHVRGLPPSNPLNLNGSETDLSVSIHPRSYERETVREQIERKSGYPSPIGFRTPDGAWSRVWLGVGAQCIGGKWRGGKGWIVGDDRHWHLNMPAAAAKRAGTDSPRKSWPQSKGFRVQVYLEAEVPAIGCGWRVVLCELRDKAVVLHHAGQSATVARDVFKTLIASNKPYRKRNQRKPSLRLIVSNPRTVTGLLDAGAAA